MTKIRQKGCLIVPFDALSARMAFLHYACHNMLKLLLNSYLCDGGRGGT
jgi:hypothetical protein